MVNNIDSNLRMPLEWSFKKGLISSPKCEGCDVRCEILYDAHHDQFFSANCGLVVVEMGVCLVDYGDELVG